MRWLSLLMFMFTFLAGFALALVALVAFTTIFGLDRLDRLEVVLISVDWIVLIVNGILLAVLFGRTRRRFQEPSHYTASNG